MADDEKPDDASKTEDPTPKKLEEGRKRGQVAQSRDLNTWVILLAATILIGTATPYMFSRLTDFLREFFAQAHTMPGTPGGIGMVLTETFKHAASASIFFFIALFLAALIGPLMQIGPMLAPEVLKPDPSKISIFKGFARLFSLRSIMEFVKGLLKMTTVGVVGFVLIYPYFDGIEHTIDLTPIEMLEESESLSIRMMVGILVALLAISLADLLYQKWEFNKQMRMTKQEVKDEYKQTEGDPFIKGKLKQIRMERARQRMMQNVPKADVVITNPTHFSVALQYDTDVADAPIVIAKGIDEVAMRIREVAKEHDIILFENPPLARTLYDTVEIDQMIPEDLYKAVAEIISFVYKKKGKIR
ncbi:MAG TPA: flagellar biosynthesis protein FlhB [Alphaproteobacteria bacterium]|nr:flagellar biosynthesis protein FlhB [Alphaproteobacteria bacterium]HNS44229.1 flagellar biosynthesis protein FlhB [Alphaproteobacteria bacterium]